MLGGKTQQRSDQHLRFFNHTTKQGFSSYSGRVLPFHRRLNYTLSCFAFSSSRLAGQRQRAWCGSTAAQI